MRIREILNLFEKLEMEVREGRDTIAKFRYDGKVVIRTKVPHKRGELQVDVLPRLKSRDSGINDNSQ